MKDVTQARSNVKTNEPLKNLCNKDLRQRLTLTAVSIAINLNWVTRIQQTLSFEQPSHPDHYFLVMSAGMTEWFACT